MYQTALPQCAKNYITIGDRECDFIPSSSGLYLSNLQGVNLELLSNLADGRYSNAQAYAEGVLTRAALFFQSQIQAAMARLGYQMPTGFKAVQACSYKSSASAAANGEGLRITRLLEVPPLSAFFIEKVLVKAAENGTVTLEIKDAFGVLLWSKTEDVLAGQTKEFFVYQEFTGDDFYILASSGTGLLMYDTTCAAPTNKACCGNGLNKQIYAISGWTGVQNSANGFGLVLVGGMQCSLSQVFCAMLPYAGQQMLQLCHIEILKDIINSARVNYTTIYADHDAINAEITSLQKSALVSIELTLMAQLRALQKQSKACIICNQFTAPYLVSKV